VNGCSSRFWRPDWPHYKVRGYKFRRASTSLHSSIFKDLYTLHLIDRNENLACGSGGLAHLLRLPALPAMTNCQQLSTLPATKSRHCPRLIVSRSLKSAIYKSLLQLCPQLRAGCARLREALLSQLRRRLYRHHDRRRHPALASAPGPALLLSGHGHKKSRALHAISSTVICRGDDGSRQPNYSTIGGDLAAAAISTAYYPASDRNASRVFTTALINTGERALSNLIQEFVLRKFTPKPKDQN
jgi:hypothetical protein